MTRLHHIQQGRGPLLVLSHALGCDLHMWDQVAQLLQDDFTVMRYDHRCHGQSACPAGSFSVDDMADDIAALLQSEGAGPCLFAGLSLGGMVAQSLAARHPATVRAIAIANSSSFYDDAARAAWQARVDTVANSGMAAITDGAMQRWFTPGFLASETGAERTKPMRQTLLACSPQGYGASCLAVANIDFRESNRRVTCPALVIAGSQDLATPPAMSADMAAQIPGATLTSIEAAHISAVEQPEAFAALLRAFFKAQG